MDRMIYKSTRDAVKVKDTDESKREAIIAYSTYNTRDSDKDISTKGMFTKTWKENFDKIRFFKNHNPNEPLGFIKEFYEDDMHAYAHVVFSKSTLGNDAFIMAQEGVMKDASFGFSPIKDKTEPLDGGGRVFREVKLYEVSLLTHWGAHPSSGVTNMLKSVDNLNLKQLEDELNLLENFVNKTSITDDSIIEIYKQIDIIKQLLNFECTPREPQKKSVNKGDVLTKILNELKK